MRQRESVSDQLSSPNQWGLDAHRMMRVQIVESDAEARLVKKDREGGLIYRQELKNGKLQIFMSRHELKPGDKVLVPGLSGGYVLMTVSSDLQTAKQGSLLGLLHYDERMGWVCWGTLCMQGIQQLEVSRY